MKTAQALRLVAFWLVLVSLAPELLAAPEEGTVRVRVNVEGVELGRAKGKDVVSVKGFGLAPDSARALPIRIFAIAIPPGAEPVALRYQSAPEVVVPGQLDIGASQSRSWQGQVKPRRDGPRQPVELVRSAGFRGYNLVDVRVAPFVYDAKRGRLSYSPEITISVDYRLRPGPVADRQQESPGLEATARSLILNYDQARSWGSAKQGPVAGAFDFVIITLDSLVPAVQPLVAWQRAKGRTVRVVTTSEIAVESAGLDLAQQIRNFLLERYQAEVWGIEDVLIVGRPFEIPMRRVWGQAPPGIEPETDFYYAELSSPDDSSWDANSNQRYGEVTDNLDFYGEVNVGRLPWSDFEVVQRICEKSVAFELNQDDSYKKNILLLAAIIDDQTDGAVFAETIVDPVAHPWMAEWTVTRLYEADSDYPSDLTLNRTNAVATWSEGRFGVVSWHSHGSPQGVYATTGLYFNTSDASRLDDDFPAIVSAASCSGSDTDYLNLGQVLMGQGAVGYLGANKTAYYGWRWEDPDDGSDQSFKYFFLTEVTSGRMTQGQAHQYALREMYQRGLWDDPIYETYIHGSLWGNPDLGLMEHTFNWPPEVPSTVSGATMVMPAVSNTYSTVITDRDGDAISLAWDWGDGSIEWTGPHPSGTEVTASHRWRQPGVYDVKVMAQDSQENPSQWSDPLAVSAHWRLRRKLGAGAEILESEDINRPKVVFGIR